MIFKVHMLAFMDGEIRNVNVPDEEIFGMLVSYFLDFGSINQLLERIFYWGQNDFQPVCNRCSVSMGDVAEINGMFFVYQSMGWKQLSAEQLEEYRAVDRHDRTFSEFVRPKD